MSISPAYRIISISMALLLLTSSIGLSIDTHYCQGQLKGISLFGTAKSCHEKQAVPPCHKKAKACHHDSDSEANDEKDNCCHNKTVVIEKSDIDATSPSVAEVTASQQQFIAAFVAAFVLGVGSDADYQQYELYKPPLPERDIRVLNQTFLI